MSEPAAFNWLDFLLAGIPVAAVAGEGINAAVQKESDGGKDITFAEMQDIGLRIAREIAARKGIRLVVSDRFTENLPTEPGYYWAIKNGEKQVVNRLPEGGFQVFGQDYAVSDVFLDGAKFAPVV